ncbi:short-chain dehydrogenase [Bartonella massiliensis]|uniref:short-chain dehydrogenase n=1 Tax=Bartonella massiliensis TaxID=929795 RepID=UPI001FEBE88F|nr:short-chain dehydrogenase [Bartonella massiliensis]
MLTPLCLSLEPQEVIIAARFLFYRDQLEVLQKNYMCVPLDYYCIALQTQFLEAVTQWRGLKYCILWLHSSAHAFSCTLIEQLALLLNLPCILHVFGSNSYDQMLVDCAYKNEVDFISVQLGRKITLNG